MSARKGPPVGHYAPVDIANVDKYFNIAIRDVEMGASKLSEIMDKYPKGVPVNKLDKIVDFWFDIGLKLEGAKSRILDEAQRTEPDADAEMRVEDYIRDDEDDDDDGAEDGPAGDGCAGEGDTDIVPSSQKSDDNNNN